MAGPLVELGASLKEDMQKLIIIVIIIVVMILVYFGTKIFS
jgi:hypothetical protein